MKDYCKQCKTCVFQMATGEKECLLCPDRKMAGSIHRHAMTAPKRAENAAG